MARGGETGSLFVNRIGKVGCAMFLMMFVGFLLVCFFAGSRNPIDGYEPTESVEYYETNREALADEINERIAPQLTGIEACFVENDKVVVEISEKDYFTVRSALLKYFDEELFELRKDTADE